MRKLSILNTKLWFIASSLLLASSLSLAADKKDAATDPAVKKSDSGICHEKSSSSFGNTKKFTPFASLEECLKSGGKLPAGQPATAAVAASMVKKSDSGICHDAKSPSYERTKKFTEFKTIDECLKSGGKLPK
jgi:hypothetical protein